MDKWYLLVATALAAGGTLKVALWLNALERMPPTETERLVGYDASHLPLHERMQRAEASKERVVRKVFLFLLAGDFFLVKLTYEAFFPH